MASYDTEAVVLRTVRYGEADSVLTLYTRERGRASAIAKGARRATGRMAGRLQPGVRVQTTVHEGRGELGTVRAAAVLDAHAGLWVSGYRLRAAGSVLESALRVLPDGEASEEAYHLLTRSLGLLARAPERPGPPRLDPVVLGCQSKLLVVSGLLPVLGACAACGEPPPLVGFAAAAGGAVCPGCARTLAADPLEPGALAALVGLLGRPLAEARDACPPPAAAGVERVVALTLRQHLGITLRSAAPL